MSIRIGGVQEQFGSIVDSDSILRYRRIYIVSITTLTTAPVGTGASVTNGVLTPPTGYTLTRPSRTSLGAGRTLYGVDVAYTANSIESYSAHFVIDFATTAETTIARWTSGTATIQNAIVEYDNILWKAVAGDDGRSGTPNINDNFQVLRTSQMASPQVVVTSSIFIGVAQRQFDISTAGSITVPLPISSFTGVGSATALLQRSGNGYLSLIHI